MIPPKPIYSYLAAAALALVTIFTFYVFQDFGPQSVIRRFHIDVARQDWRDIDLVAKENVSSPATQSMIRFVNEMVVNNASYEIVSLKRLHKEVLAAVEYRLPNGAGVGVVWHVVQSSNDWRVDCRATVEGMLHSSLEP
ncbi:MAG TPA: hypothetical protein VHE55_08790 [Fimbriimonadaceae bacterium]|nr:hypothetical protein [Fimbriimonadaceae bacterium]